MRHGGLSATAGHPPASPFRQPPAFRSGISLLPSRRLRDSPALRGTYLSADESRGTCSRTRIILITGAGRPSAWARAAFFQLQDRLPPWPGLPIRERIPMHKTWHGTDAPGHPSPLPSSLSRPVALGAPPGAANPAILPEIPTRKPLPGTSDALLPGTARRTGAPPAAANPSPRRKSRPACRFLKPRPAYPLQPGPAPPVPCPCGPPRDPA
jgi:hypothetical protein